MFYECQVGSYMSGYRLSVIFFYNAGLSFEFRVGLSMPGGPLSAWLSSKCQVGLELPDCHASSMLFPYVVTIVNACASHEHFFMLSSAHLGVLWTSSDTDVKRAFTGLCINKSAEYAAASNTGGFVHLYNIEHKKVH